ncbi:hypothetical protein XFF6992_370007 [Xanthomonas citri pv. fuscans]|uniref:Uncharacterized protein n=1 Tax=Xanthomonas campestris pv. phaseoli TaxID=317013 RepID=A0A7Z7NIQ2_XANCH|nr:hypothetical protein XFF6990_290222 [Xanthomonas citri pv. fuscans]SOO19707.1 hypothetical protein XFF6992_370007 [Xanthomonas citri pv. fuscans]SOO26135.1 hypothetical protein XFF6991_520109 [Xanthomonas phaseoli pv. phaseoli]SOO33705.1 hypothetical protein XFF6994_3130007 [Xanthomonas citri pv. fuscans]
MSLSELMSVSPPRCEVERTTSPVAARKLTDPSQSWLWGISRHDAVSCQTSPTLGHRADVPC